MIGHEAGGSELYDHIQHDYAIRHVNRDTGADLEIAFDAGGGGARTVAVTPQQRQQRSMLSLNEDSPTFLETNPPATAGEDRFRFEFRIDTHKRLTVTAYDLRRHTVVLDRQPVIRLA